MIEDFIPSPLGVFITFVIAAGISLLCGYLSILTERGWKNLGTIVVLMGGLGVVGLTMIANQQISTVAYPILMSTYDGKAGRLSNQIESDRRYFCETVFVKSTTSPKLFDANVRDQRKLCEWYSNAYQRIQDVANPALELSDSFFDDMPTLETTSWQWTLKALSKSKLYHDNFRVKAEELKKSSEWSHLKMFYYVVSPFVLALALGLQVGKSQYG